MYLPTSNHRANGWLGGARRESWKFAPAAAEPSSGDIYLAPHRARPLRRPGNSRTRRRPNREPQNCCGRGCLKRSSQEEKEEDEEEDCSRSLFVAQLLGGTEFSKVGVFV